MAYLSEQGLESRSINRKLSAIQAFFEFLNREGVLAKNPARNIDRPKVAKRLPGFIRSDALADMLASPIFLKDYNGQKNQLIVALFYTCGLRRDELINLRLESFDFSSMSVKVLGKRNKERLIPIADSIAERVKSFIELRNTYPVEDDFLFLTIKGRKMYPGLVYKIVKNYLSQVTTVEKKSPHVLRHSFATHLLNEGANLQSIKELLGHSSLAATQVYTHTSLEKLKDVYNKSHPRNKK